MMLRVKKIIYESYEVLSKVKSNFIKNPLYDKLHHTVNNIKAKNIYITKADKSSNVVILDKKVYDERIQKSIDEGPYKSYGQWSTLVYEN